MSERIAVLGAGSWGLAVAGLLADNGHDLSLWEYKPDECDRLIKNRGHAQKLPDFVLPESVTIGSDLSLALKDRSLIVITIPAQSVRSVLRQMPAGEFGYDIVSLSKGIEVNTLQRMSEVINEELAIGFNRVAVLSGPSHAEEVVRGMPTTVVAAGKNEALVEKIQDLFSGNNFRVYKSDDMIGVELGGSLKNIIAIAAGIASGLDMGDNTTGAILTRGLAEISRLGIAMGAKAKTFSGLSGVGDLITTCISPHSRNRFVGEAIGRGRPLDDILEKMTMVAEGVQTARSGHALAEKHNVEMPITDQIYQVLFENKPAADGVNELMGRSLKSEIWQ